MRTTITPPPNGPRNPPRYSAARARRSSPAAGAAHARSGRSGAMSAGQGRRRPARPTGQRPSRPRAQRSRRATCSSVIPTAGSVATSRVGAVAGGRPGVARRVERVVDPRRRTVTRMTVDGLELPVRWSAVGAEKVRNGGRTGRRSAGTRWSEAFSSQPLHHTRSKIRVSARRYPDAVAEIRWSTPSTPIQVPGGGAVGSNPNSEITPSMSTNSSGLSPECAGSGMGVPVRRRLFRSPSLACRDRARVKTRPRGADDGGEGRHRHSDPTRALTPSS